MAFVAARLLTTAVGSLHCFGHGSALTAVHGSELMVDF